MCSSDLRKMRSYHGISTILMAWIYGKGWKSLIFGKKYHLHAPTFSIATHVSRKYLAPNVNWISFIKEHSESQYTTEKIKLPVNAELYYDS